MDKRVCGACVECCVTIGDDKRKAHEPCVNLRPNRRGCSRYQDRPYYCRGFVCTYLMGRRDKRPDRCGVLAHVTTNRLSDGPCVNLAECRDGALDANEAMVERYAQDRRWSVVMLEYRDGRTVIYSQDPRFIDRLRIANAPFAHIPRGTTQIRAEFPVNPSPLG